MPETPLTIALWARETFGPASLSVASARANQEMSELLTDIALGKTSKLGEEIADIIIVLYHLAGSNDIDLQEAIEKKMKVNRARQWDLTGQGTGYHR